MSIHQCVLAGLFFWCRNVDIALDGLSNIDKLFGIWNREEDFLLLNHLLIVAKKNTSMNTGK